MSKNVNCAQYLNLQILIQTNKKKRESLITVITDLVKKKYGRHENTYFELEPIFEFTIEGFTKPDAHERGAFITNAKSKTSSGALRLYIPAFIIWLQLFNQSHKLTRSFISTLGADLPDPPEIPHLRTVQKQPSVDNLTLKSKKPFSGIAESPTLFDPSVEISDSAEERNWLSPLNNIDLPFIERDSEFLTLDNFLTSKNPFKILPIIAPSGAGKTRLVVEWMRKSQKLEGWYCGFLKVPDSYSWDKWTPSLPTLIVIDYIHTLSNSLRQIVHRLDLLAHQNSEFAPTRLILLDHTFPTTNEEFLKISPWKEIFRSDSELQRLGAFDSKSGIFFNPSPIALDKTKSHDQVIPGIIRSITRNELPNKTFEKAIEYLKTTDGAYQPLFAALVGNALNKKSDFWNWNRRDLIKSYLSGMNRIPWQSSPSNIGSWVGCIVSAATIRQGGTTTLDDVVPHMPTEITGDQANLSEIVSLSSFTVSSKIDPIISPFLPDLLAETYFLLWLLDHQYDTVRLSALNKMIDVSKKDTFSQQRVYEIRSFFVRLINNLADDTRSEDRQYYPNQGMFRFWKPLEKFATPNNFDKYGALRSAISAIVLDIFYADSRHLVYTAEFEDKLNLDDVALGNDPKLFEQEAYDACRYISFQSRYQKVTTEDIANLRRIVFRSEYNRKRNITPLMLAAKADYKKLLFELRQHGVDLNEETSDNGFTALHYAVEADNDMFTHCLCALGADPNKVTYPLNVSPLMLAAQSGKIEPARELLDRKNIDLNITDSERGWSALMAAIVTNNNNIVELILEKKPDLSIRDKLEQFSALDIAVYTENSVAVSLLINAGANVNSMGKDRTSPLHLAAEVGNVHLIDELVAAGADIDASTSFEGVTALHIATKNSDTAAVLHLLRNGANPNMQTYSHKRTPLIEAAYRGDDDIIRMLLGHKANAKAHTVDGYTALGIALYFNNESSAKILKAFDPDMPPRVIVVGRGYKTEDGQIVLTESYGDMMGDDDKS